jgi:DNA-binding winged helix-turn-helix (wHTH) protein
MSRIDLAREEDFVLGSLLVRPARREIESRGVTRRVQHRIMQVLVALAHPTWEVVSQRELISRCWSGLSVTDDAIGRCIGALRRLAAEWPEPPFAIETIGGVGYELQVGPAGSPQRRAFA